MLVADAISANNTLTPKWFVLRAQLSRSIGHICQFPGPIGLLLS